MIVVWSKYKFFNENGDAIATVEATSYLHALGVANVQCGTAYESYELYRERL